MLAMKQQLAQGAPVVIGMMVGGSFMQDMEGQEWIPTQTTTACRLRRPCHVRGRL
jgi:hypothetical protein